MAGIPGLGLGPIPIGETLFPENDQTSNRCGLIFACRSKSRYHERINHDVRCDECGADCTIRHGVRCGVVQECICNSDNEEVTTEMLTVDNNILKSKLVITESKYMATVKKLISEIAHLLEEKKTDKEKKNELRERVFQLEQKLARTRGGSCNEEVIENESDNHKDCSDEEEGTIQEITNIIVHLEDDRSMKK